MLFRSFCTAHVVPGIDFTNDPLLQGRIHSYVDTQISRLGGMNFHELPINAPLVEVHNNQRDGIHRRAIPRGRVAYEPNSLGGGCPFQAGARGFVSFPQPVVEDKVRGKPEKFADHYSQATLFYDSQSDVEKNHIVAAFRFELTRVQTPAVRQRVVALLRNVDETLAARVADGLGMALPPAQPRALEPPVKSEVDVSAPLSLFAFPGDGGVAGRRVALMVADGVDARAMQAACDALVGAGAAPRYIGARLGKVKAKAGSPIEIEATLETMPSPMWDAVVIDGSADALAQVGAAVEFVKEQFRHCKTMLVLGAAPALLAAAGIDGPADSGFIDASGQGAGAKAAIDAFIKAAGRHKHYEREKDPSPV